MSRRAALAVLVAAGCQATLGPGEDDTEVTVPDAQVPRDAPIKIDAPLDARPCEGGTMASVAPDGSCLVFITTPRTYVQAKTACAAMNAHLAYLKTAAVDTFAEQFVGTTDTWIGANDQVTEGTFLWEDGSALVFTNWADGEPNNAGDDRAVFLERIAGARAGKKWDDRPCDPSQVATSGNFASLCQY
jgi:hypothetical protein